MRHASPVMLDDCVAPQDLFGANAELEACVIQYDRSGRSLGTAEVTFADAADAEAAVAELNNRTLDGQ